MDIKHAIKNEIASIKKSAKPIHVRLYKYKDGYEGKLAFDIPNGDYILNARSIKDKLVSIECKDGFVRCEIDSEEQEINAFLTKDEASLLRAVDENIKLDDFAFKPSFIVGPPGTGKTKVITAILEKVVKAGKRVLVASPTNMAVENVFERLSPKELNIRDDEVVLTIKTSLEDLKKFSPQAIKEKKIAPIEDEISVLREALEELFSQKSELQAILEAAKATKEASSTKVSNLKKEIALLNKKQKISLDEIDTIEHRLGLMGGNGFLAQVAKSIQAKKFDELNSQKALKQTELKHIELKLDELHKKLQKMQDEDKTFTKHYNEAKNELREVENSIEKIEKRIDELDLQINEINSDNYFSSAKIVGSTLGRAALSQKIQEAEFDMIIVDEASMALMPFLLAATQSLNKEGVSVAFKECGDLNEAQKKAVKLALRSKIVFVGDPKQLPPIARTPELQKSVFSYHKIDKIFFGEKLDNAVMLDTNFRNHPDITKLASELFYGGLLKSGKEHPGKDSLFVRRSISKMVPFDGSYVNHGNAKICMEQVNKALDRGRRCIGIITPYRKQADLIREKLQSILEEYPDADIQVGTIHTFQGKEKEIIIYDLTFSPGSDGKVPATYKGNIDSNVAKLLNVAMTRAKEFFIVIGDIDGISNLQDNSLVIKKWVVSISNINKKK